MKNTARFDIRDFFCAIKRPMIKRIVRIWRLKRPSVYNFITKFLSYNNSYFSISNLSNIKIDSITESRERERESRLRKRKQKERKKERNLSISRSLKRYTEKTRGMLTNSKLCRVSLGLWESLGRGGGSQFSLVTLLASLISSRDWGAARRNKKIYQGNSFEINGRGISRSC